MTAFFPSHSLPATPSILTQTFTIWLTGNLGGTGLLSLYFGIENPADLTTPLLAGLTAALISLAYVPLAWPFLALANRTSTTWHRPLLAATGIVTVFSLFNYLLLNWLPADTFSQLLRFSQPYLGMALLAVAWLYRPRSLKAAQPAKLSRPAPLLNAWCVGPNQRRVLSAQ